jgi:DNA invertase Pin-like site-specific DNA recombinase
MTTTTDKPRATAYGYARVSTKRQEIKGYSLEAQEEQIKNYCEQNNIELLGFYSEAESGKSSTRPKLIEVLNLSNLSTSILIVAKIDRLTRDLNFLTKLQAHGTPFIALDMPEANPTMLQVMVSFAEYENRLRSARTREGMQKAKAKGKVFGTQGHKNLNSYYEKVADSVDPKNTRNQIEKEIAKLSKGKATPEKEKELEALNLKRNAIERKIGRKLIKPASDKVSEIAMQRALAIKPYVDECVKEGADSLRKVAKCLTDKRIKTPSGSPTWNVGNVQTLYKQLNKINV